MQDDLGDLKYFTPLGSVHFLKSRATELDPFLLCFEPVGVCIRQPNFIFRAAKTQARFTAIMRTWSWCGFASKERHVKIVGDPHLRIPQIIYLTSLSQMTSWIAFKHPGGNSDYSICAT